ncbi:MAG: SCO family protein [Myxococcota bacterium]
MANDLRRELLRAGAGLGVFVLLMAAVVIGRQLGDNESSREVPQEYMGDEIVPPRIAPAFNLVDRTGKRLRREDLEGRIVLLGFAYTNCATICPLIFRSFLGVERQLAAKSLDNVALVFITLDPDLDTPERLQEATLYMGGHWNFLTEDESELKEVWKSYGVVREKNAGVVDHSGITYLIDTHGLLRVRYGGTPQPSVILNDIEKLIGSS